MSRWLHGKQRVQVAALAGAPALWMAVLYAGSLFALFVTSLYTLSEDGAHIEHTLGKRLRVLPYVLEGA